MTTTPDTDRCASSATTHPPAEVNRRRPCFRSRRAVIPVAGLAMALALVAAACGSDGGSDDPTGTAASALDVSAGLPQGSEPFDIDASTFTTEIDNPYWPMVPGTRWFYQETDDEGVTVEVNVVVTGETKRLANGVTAVVVRDWVTGDDGVIEDTYDWYAQDADGNLWYMGEDTAEFEDGEVSSTAGSWEAGVDGALPGIILPADPKPGMRYRQEYYAGEAEDSGEVLSVSEMAEVPAGSYTSRDLLLTKDTVGLEPDVLEYKLYAPGVGPVLAIGVSGGGGREELVRVDTVPTDGLITQLGAPPTLD